jgi:hypothetical protein
MKKAARVKSAVVTFAAVLILTACAASDVSTPILTEILIPSTATPTPTPVTPSATPRPLLGARDVLATPTSSVEDIAPQVEQEMVNQAIMDLAAYLDIEGDEIQLIALESAVWTTPDLNCGDRVVASPGLAIEGYRLLLRVESTTYEYHTDNAARKLQRCLQATNIFGSGSILLLEIDPVAAQLVAMAQRQIASQLDLPVRRVRLVDVVGVTWPDSSLGCPAPNQTYNPINVAGYRIVLSAGDERYIYHTDTERIIPCDSRRERLPAEQTPEPDGG